MNKNQIMSYSTKDYIVIIGSGLLVFLSSFKITSNIFDHVIEKKNLQTIKTLSYTGLWITSMYILYIHLKN
jgi:hypothetical protein